MCGICGASLSPQEEVNADVLAAMLLLGIEERGRHATGIAWDEGSEVVYAKEATTATDFVLDMQLPQTRTFIGHTRWASQGSPSNPLNNHPIVTSGLVGIHNGVIWNDDDIFGALGDEGVRHAQVDSEAIFAWIALSGYTPAEALSHVRGSAAVAWMQKDEPNSIHLARGSSSPVVIALTERGSVIFASTRTCLDNAVEAAGVAVRGFRELPEGTYLKLSNGAIVSEEEFAVERRILTATERRALNLA